MKKFFHIFVWVGLFLILTAPMVLAAEKAPQKIQDLATNTLAPIGADPIIIEAVKAENAKGKTLDEIKAMDEKWKNTAGVADFMKALMDSACGKHIRELQKSQPYFAEIFVMDNQGANVAMTDKTSDYWQGD
jgi:predicted nucleic-acid-binding protein